MRIRSSIQAVALGVAFHSVIGCAGSAPQRSTPASVGRSLDLSLPAIDGRRVDVGGESGRVRVIDFWATWCEPCREALPALDALARELGPRGLSVYGVSVDEDRDRIQEFLATVRVSFPILWDKGAVAVSRFDVSYMPVTLLVDRKGVIRHVHQGWNPSSASAERREIEALLAEP